MIEASIALLAAAATAIAVSPKLISILASLKLRQTINDDAPSRHKGKQGTPMMGGLIILLGAAVGTAVGLGLLFYTGGSRVLLFEVAAVGLLTLASAAIGFADDYLIATRGKSLGLKAREKLVLQFAVAILFMIWVHAVRADFPTSVAIFGGKWINLGWLYYPLATLMIVGMSNAVNLTDGLDGLVSGLTVICAVTLGVTVGMTMQHGLGILSYAIAGGCLGFLWYNSNPAKVFMGDTGSLALGAAMSGIAIAGRAEVFFLIAGIVFVLEAFSVIIQVISFKTLGKRVFKMTPIHHHFELLGWAEQKIVVRFWIVQLAVCIALLAMLIR